MAMPSADADELAKFGYKQELDRSLGCFLVRRRVQPPEWPG